MKYSAALLAFAAAALGNQIEERGHDDYGYGHESTLTTYTTVTTCPVTSTYTKEGSTYCVTDLTTSTIVVTECHGCGVTTIPGKDTTVYDHETQYATRTTVCPVTETYTQEGHVYTKTYITTKTVEESRPTTYYESVKKPDTTVKEHVTEYTTRTSLCPVTETIVESGKTYTKIYTTTSLIEEQVPVTDYETIQKPDVTKEIQETYYSTRTSLCPVTETIVENGKTVTKIYTTTSLIEEHVSVTDYKTIKQPDVTKKIEETEYATVTSLCPVTETVTLHGKETTLTYTTTKTFKTNAYTTIVQTEVIPGETETAYQVAKSTLTEVYPVTEVHTEKGKAVTKTYTSTKVVVTRIPTTIEAVHTIYETDTDKEVKTKYSQVYYTVGGGTVVVPVPGKPTTYVVSKTSAVQAPPVTVTSEQQPPATPAPVVVPTGAAHVNKAPAIAFMAGVAGAIAIL